MFHVPQLGSEFHRQCLKYRGTLLLKYLPRKKLLPPDHEICEIRELSKSLRNIQNRIKGECIADIVFVWWPVPSPVSVSGIQTQTQIVPLKFKLLQFKLSVKLFFLTKNFKFKLKFSSIQNQASASLISNWNFKTIENCLLRFFKYILSLASLIYLLHSIQWYISHYLMCWYFK